MNERRNGSAREYKFLNELASIESQQMEIRIWLGQSRFETQLIRFVKMERALSVCQVSADWIHWRDWEKPNGNDDNNDLLFSGAIIMLIF